MFSVLIKQNCTDGRGVGGRMDTCICTPKSRCCPPEIITTLLVGYTQVQNKKWGEKKKLYWKPCFSREIPQSYLRGCLPGWSPRFGSNQTLFYYYTGCYRGSLGGLPKGSQSAGFSSCHVWMWEMDHKEVWAPKNWCFWTMVLEKTL